MGKLPGTFALFRPQMPMIGWVCVHTIVELLRPLGDPDPWIALALLGYIGGKMLLDGIRGEEAEEGGVEASAGALFMQGIATSIDALSVGFTISEYGWLMALTAAIIIAVVRLNPLHGGSAHRQVRHTAFRQGKYSGRCRSLSASGWKFSSPECSEYQKPGASADTKGFFNFRLCFPVEQLTYFMFSGSKSRRIPWSAYCQGGGCRHYRWRPPPAAQRRQGRTRSMAFSRLRGRRSPVQPPVVMVSSIRNRL